MLISLDHALYSINYGNAHNNIILDHFLLVISPVEIYFSVVMR